MLGVAMGIILDLLVLPALLAAPQDGGLPPDQLLINPEAQIFPATGVKEYQRQLYFDLFGSIPDTDADWIYLLDAPADAVGAITGATHTGELLTFTVAATAAIPVDLAQLTPAQAQWAIDHQYTAQDVSGTISTGLHARAVEAMAIYAVDGNGDGWTVLAVLGDEGSFELAPFDPMFSLAARDDEPPGECQPFISPPFEFPCDVCAWQLAEDLRIAECKSRHLAKDIWNDFDNEVAALTADITQRSLDIQAELQEQLEQIKSLAAKQIIGILLASGAAAVFGILFAGLLVIAALHMVAVRALSAARAAHAAAQRAMRALVRDLSRQLAQAIQRRDDRLADSDAQFALDQTLAQVRHQICIDVVGCD